MSGPDEDQEGRVVCDVCGGPIDPDDFDRGQAVMVLKRRYCSKCMTAAIQKSRSPDQPPEFNTPKPKPKKK
jgi:hypothetical protein